MNSTTDKKNSTIANLVERNSQNMQNLMQSSMPVMVPIQEKDWDTMLDILQTNAELYPKVLEMFTELITVEEMNHLLEDWSEMEQTKFNQALTDAKTVLHSQQVQAENILRQMKDYELQVGKTLEKITRDSLAKGSELRKEIEKAKEQLDIRTFLIHLAICVGSSVAASVISVILFLQFS